MRTEELERCESVEKVDRKFVYIRRWTMFRHASVTLIVAIIHADIDTLPLLTILTRELDGLR
jgi:hypothetical protein